MGYLSKEIYAQRIIDGQNKWVGVTRIMNCGKKATIIAYRGYKDIDVQFEDGAIVTHKSTGAFNNKEIIHPNCRKKLIKLPYTASREGFILHSKKWGDIECIAYKSCRDFDLHFKKYDIIRRHCTNYSNFLLDKVSPSFSQHGSGQSLRLSVGDTQFNPKFNQTMTVIELGNKSRYKVQFEDGYTTPWLRNPGQFRSGNIHNPKAAQGLAEQKWLGQTTIARNGLKMTIIKVVGGKKDCKSIDVQFEDGAIVKNVIPAVFTMGEIKHPTLHANTIRAKKKLQDVEIQNINTGLTTKIIRYNSATDFEVQFESGCIRRYTDISKFYDGTLPHPFPYSIGTVTMNKFAYIYKGEGNFYCTCNKCGISDIMNLSEIRSHQCIT